MKRTTVEMTGEENTVLKEASKLDRRSMTKFIINAAVEKARSMTK